MSPASGVSADPEVSAGRRDRAVRTGAARSSFLWGLGAFGLKSNGPKPHYFHRKGVNAMYRPWTFEELAQAVQASVDDVLKRQQDTWLLHVWYRRLERWFFHVARTNNEQWAMYLAALAYHPLPPRTMPFRPRPYENFLALSSTE